MWWVFSFLKRDVAGIILVHERLLVIWTTKWYTMELIIFVMLQESKSTKQCAFKPDGLKSNQTAFSGLIILQPNEKKSITILSYVADQSNTNHTLRSKFKKADLCESLMYSTGSSACPAGPGRTCPHGYRSQTLTIEDGEKREKRGCFRIHEERR